jgi:hypothetical protein
VKAELEEGDEARIKQEAEGGVAVEEEAEGEAHWQ